MAAKKKTAKKSHPHHSTAITRVTQPIVIREPRPMARHKGHKGGRRGVSSEKALMGFVLGGFVAGFIDKPGGFGASIPTVPILGRMGTIAVAAHFIGKGKAGIVTDIRNAAAVVASYEFGLKGSVSGDEI